MYNDPSNPTFEDGELDLGQGCPFESLDAYLDLREVFGEEWLTLTLVEYVQRMGDEELREWGAPKLVELVSLAHAEYAKARAADFECSLTSNEKRAA